MENALKERLAEAYRVHQSGDTDRARRLYREILSLDPQQADANNLMGVLCLQCKEPVKAIRHIKRALQTAPREARSYANLGIAFKDLGRMQESADAFAEAVRLEPDNGEFLSSHGNALRLAGTPGKAVTVLESALRKASGNPGLRHNLALAQNDMGVLLNRNGDPAKAIVHFRRALELNPDHPQALLNLGLTLEQVGETEGAERHYQAAIRVEPTLADAHFQLAHLRGRKASATEIEAMKQRAQRPETPLSDRVKLAYALGLALESTGDYHAAFQHMEQAHRLQSSRLRYDPAAETLHFQRVQELFSRERLEQGPFGSDDSRPVFICGMPRSGTNLTEQILSSHPDVYGAGETTALAHAANALSTAPQRPFPEGLQSLRPDALRHAAERYLGELTRPAGTAERVTDTTPMNFLLIGFAAQLFPRARFIVCMREPMDNCLSLFRQMLTGGNEYSHQLEHLGGYYRLHAQLVSHWQDMLPTRLLVSRYEDLVLEQEQEVRRLLEFCKLPFDPACLAHHENRRVVRSPNASQVRQPVYSSSIGAWKNYEKELEPLHSALGTQPTLL